MMHAEVLDYVAEQIERYGPFRKVLEIGSRDINGSVRGLFRAEEYVGVDRLPGPGVDVVMDAVEYRRRGFDAVVSCETFEHARAWRDLVGVAARALMPEGVFILTCASGSRERHSAFDEQPIRADEYYANVDAEEAREVLERWFAQVEVGTAREGQDLQAVCVTPLRG